MTNEIGDLSLPLTGPVMPNQLLLLETLLLGTAFFLAACLPALAQAFWKRLEDCICGISPRLAILITFLLPLVLRAALLPIVGIPKPNVMDEFSYLLGGETFALGRLANPAPPVAEAFRALYVLTTPSYGSIYPPAQAMLLAAGQLVFGHPWWGVFLSIGLMSATTCWMARAFVPERWAFVGGLLIGLQIGVFSYWMNSYWGGSLAAIGGNLVAGGYGRLRTRLTWGPAIAVAVGMCVLGLRRPVEGLVLVLSIAGFLAYDVAVRRPRPAIRETLQFLLPMAAGLACFAAFTAIYDLRSTGDPLSLPYSVGEKEASSVPPFVFQGLRHRPEMPDNIARFDADYRVANFRQAHSLRGYLELKGEQAYRALWVYTNPILLPPFLLGIIGIWLLRQWKLGIVMGLALATLLIAIPGHPHYLAPFLPAYCLVLLMGFQMLRKWRPTGRTFGLPFTRWLIAAFACGVLLSAAELVSGTQVFAKDAEFACCGLNWPHPREALEAELQRQDTKALVLVRYGTYNFIHYEFVYNQADLNAAKIIWARDLGREKDRELMRAFPGRDVWILDAGMNPDGKAVLRRAGKEFEPKL